MKEETQDRDINLSTEPGQLQNNLQTGAQEPEAAKPRTPH